ncbi:hypothetical protein OC610_19075 [Pseudomonas sp. SAICEU22]|uniref:Uncharacterized protein n=1 Tax=Pseudomonas agronomica TaxID=2979328 RepID=A0ABT3FBQ4_9PSED|nr:hypothetical protein [Pseudomonas agronomica]MCW1246525.1 hypothetical protein [Pseudomonas agronomica]
MEGLEVMLYVRGDATAMRYIERQKTLNFLQDVTVGLYKPPGFNACALAVESFNH